MGGSESGGCEGVNLAVSWFVGHEEEENQGQGGGDAEDDAVGRHGGTPFACGQLDTSLRRVRG